jgi:ferrous iron transport protein A
MPETMSAAEHSRPFPLAMADQGAQIRIVTLRAGRELDRRLRDMGLNPGVELKVQQRQPGGALVVMRGETRLALGGGMAHKIMVIPIQM